MKILMINVSCGIESTGRICTDLAVALKHKGHEVKIAYGRGVVPEKYREFAVKIGTNSSVYLHALKARIFDDMGLGSVYATKKFIKWVKEFDPDVIHLHNIHGYYINIKILFEYLYKCNKKILWTLHDCWSFTGHCAYFDYVNCKKWMTECSKCKQKKDYPARWFIDHSHRNFLLKKELFTSIKNITFITPSKWLANLVKKSYLKDYDVKVIYNGINTEIFKPTKSDLKERLNIEKKKVILGVASVWDKRKGLDTFIKLSKRLDSEYQIILVGLSKRQVKLLPDNIIGIQRTNNINELVELYSLADVFVNPTLEDNYPTTNLEAIACGTPVISFDTGGSGESAVLYGTKLEKKCIEEIINAIKDSKYILKNVNLDYHFSVEQYETLYTQKKSIHF